MMSRCIVNEASHYERHRDIAKLVNDFQSCDDAYQQMPVRKRRQSRKQDSGEDQSTNNESTATDNSSNDLTTLDENFRADVEVEETFQSPSERRAFRRSMKDKRNQEKAFRNQQKVVLYVSQEHINRVARAIHGAQYNVDRIGGHPETKENDSDIIFNRNDTYNAAIKEHRSWFKEQVRGSRARNGKKGMEARKRQHDKDVGNGLLPQQRDMEALVSAILSELGVPDHDQAYSNTTCASFRTPSRGRKQKASIILQLRKEIAADIKKSENDSRARQSRMEGYWRYVNGTVTDRLANNAQVVDRSTGVRLEGMDGRQRFARMPNTDQMEDLEMEADEGHDEELRETN
jgi:hypothetical protein